MKRLPKTWRGAKVVRGLGMDAKKMDELAYDKALSEFDATKPMFVVMGDRDLEHGSFDIKAFRSEKDALRYARACGNGNCDHRVLKVTEQTLVVATDNEL